MAVGRLVTVSREVAPTQGLEIADVETVDAEAVGGVVSAKAEVLRPSRQVERIPNFFIIMSLLLQKITSLGEGVFHSVTGK